MKMKHTRNKGSIERGKTNVGGRILGYYEGENLIRPVFDELSTEEFNKKYPGKKPVYPEHLTDDDDYVPVAGNEDIVDFI